MRKVCTGSDCGELSSSHQKNLRTMRMKYQPYQLTFWRSSAHANDDLQEHKNYKLKDQRGERTLHLGSLQRPLLDQKPPKTMLLHDIRNSVHLTAREILRFNIQQSPKSHILCRKNKSLMVLSVHHLVEYIHSKKA